MASMSPNATQSDSSHMVREKDMWVVLRPEHSEQLLDIDHEAEHKVISKVDRHIIPVVMLLYLFSFLDRVNIGTARLYGLEENLGLSSHQFQLAIILMFVTYVLSEVPSNLILKKATPSRWIAFIAFSWGVVATCMGLVHNFAGLAVCRLLLGLFEGGLFPGLAIYLTFFYTKRELALRIGYLFVCSALSGSLGGLLAFAIGYMDGIGGYRGWRWIFILEGIPTALLGIATLFLLPNDPDTATFLSPEEKALLKNRIMRQAGYTRSGMQFSRVDAWKAARDWKVMVFCLAQFGSGTMLYGYSTFLPTIIKSLGKWSVPQTQALTIPCYALGAITYIVVAIYSDRIQRRGICVLVCGSISIVGYAILLADLSPGVKYFATLLVSCGLYVVLGIPLSWLPTLLPRYGKRTTATGMQLACSNLAGILVPFLYPLADGPRYLMGSAVTLGLLVFSVTCATSMSLYFKWVNARRAEGKEDYKLAGKPAEEIEEMGDDSPHFMYVR